MSYVKVWIHAVGIYIDSLEWANEYYAVSVSESLLVQVRRYIDKQEDHHKKKTYADEVEEFLRMYRFDGHG
jgi:hypothetical protein